MKKNVLRILIASPGDVTAERDLAEKIVGETNQGLGPNSEVLFQSIRAESDVSPGIGSDPQAVINAQVPEFEIFVGIMWTRLGTPTPRAVSGTVEEFERAIAAWKRSPAAVRVMFFFNQSNAPIDQIDLDQLKALREFKASLTARGVYFKEYRDEEQFRALLSSALWRTAREPSWGSQEATRVAISDEVQVAVSYAQELAEDGDDDWLDLLATYEEAMERSNESALRMGGATGTLGARIQEKSTLLQEFLKGSQPSASKARRLINDVADELVVFARALEGELPTFRESWNTVMDRFPLIFARAGETQLGSESEGAARAKLKVAELGDVLSTTIQSLTEFRGRVVETPRLTSQYKKAARRALAAIDALIYELGKVREFADSM